MAIRRCCVIKASSSSQERERGAPPLRLPRVCCAKCLKRFEIHHNLSLIPRKTPQWLPTGVQPALRESRADGYAEEHRQRWNGAAGHAWVAAARCSIGCSSHSPIDSPIWQPRVVPISCSTVAAEPKPDSRDCGPDRNHGAMRRRRHLGTDAIRGARGPTPRRDGNLHCANAQTYPFEPESFDLIVSRFSVMVLAGFGRGTREPAARRAQRRRAANDRRARSGRTTRS